jgi:hypothetical protein
MICRLLLLVFIPFAGFAQDPLLSKVIPTPENVLTMFREAGMSPVEHTLTDSERGSVAAAFKALPPLHQSILKDHLAGISFLDNMPNTALTSIVNPGDSLKRYHITFRAAILKQTISEWLTEKERTLYNSSDTSVNLHAGNLNAIIYVLLHETTHVIDGSLDIFNTRFAAKFAQPLWRDRTTLIYTDSLLRTNQFRRGGRIYPSAMAYQLYSALQKTPLVSIYSTSSWSEDLAECLTVYHLTQILKQPFSIELRAGGKTILNYAPFRNSIVSERMKSLDIFYVGKNV